ncbi:hypothetical protein K0O13_08270 [Mammaliicoccus sciuri]|uniref:hypothetical protein n=1 Tax=Mammaliicoccus sciuri TaxID=1296 RepID=UPI001C62A660|nr:hypothetical protein [Mammaliicoccus sciuri]QYG30095.1 hypothetical protein K0O13_08270 [Mammaliicoccus sciuri]
MTKLYYADELKDITEQNMSEKARELLEVIIDSTMEQATKGRYYLDIESDVMVEIRSILSRKGYKIINLSNIHWYRISWY